MSIIRNQNYDWGLVFKIMSLLPTFFKSITNILIRTLVDQRYITGL